MGRLVRVTACFFALGLSSTAALSSVGSCGAKSARPAANTQAWPSKQVLYYFDAKERLVRSDLDGRERRVLSAHGFEGPLSPHVSADGRFVIYGGNLDAKRVAQLWAYDTVSGSDRMLMENAPWSINEPLFSPDGRRIAVFVEYRSEAKTKGVGLYVFDLDTQRHTYAGWPKESQFQRISDTWMDPEWSTDGRLFVGMRGGIRNGEFLREFWLYDSRSSGFKRVDGRFNEGSLRHEFKVNGKPVALTRENDSQAGHGPLASSGNRFVAFIDGKHRLIIQQGSEKRVAAIGSHNDCDGETLWLEGWIDGDRYLVYSLDLTPYIYDPRTGKTAALDVPRDFVWAPAPRALAPN